MINRRTVLTGLFSTPFLGLVGSTSLAAGEPKDRFLGAARAEIERRGFAAGVEVGLSDIENNAKIWRAWAFDVSDPRKPEPGYTHVVISNVDIEHCAKRGIDLAYLGRRRADSAIATLIKFHGSAPR